MTTTYDHADMKDRDKWIKSTTMIDDVRQMTLSTRKTFSGKLTTTATVATLSGDWEVHKMYTDFHQVLESSDVRVTAKAMREQHARHKAQIHEIEKLAINHYYPKKEA